MNKDIASELWKVANVRRQRAYLQWTGPGRLSEKQREAARLECGEWATACNELYAQMNPTVKTGVLTHER